MVLSALERRIPGFPGSLRLVTGASGGMVGAAAYVTGLNEILSSRNPHVAAVEQAPAATPEAKAKADDEVDALKSFNELLTYAPRAGDLLKYRFISYPDLLTPVVARLVLRDFPSIFCPVRLTRDRGTILEDQFATISRPLAETTFAQLYPMEKAGRIPSLVLSPMMVEDGRRLLISNLDLDALTANEGPLIGPEKGQGRTASREGLHVLSRSAVEFFRLFPKAHPTFRVGTAVRMNATFPYVSPVLNLPTDPTRRVIDAGVYDNYGVNLAANWILQNAEWLAEHTSGVVLVQVRAFSNEQRLAQAQREMVGDRSGKKSLYERFEAYIGSGLQFLSSPLAAVDTARQSINYFRNDNQVAVLGELFTVRTGDHEFFRTVVFSCDQERSQSPATIAAGTVAGPARPATTSPETLSWTLSTGEQQHQIPDRIDDEINQQRLDGLTRWWGKDHATGDNSTRPPTPWKFAKPL